MKMRKILNILFASVVLFSLAAPFIAQDKKAASKGKAPLKLVGKYEFPNDVKGDLGHLLPEPQANRLFTTAQGSKAVVIFDLRTHKLVRTISGVEHPHCVLYRDDLNRVYVIDGGSSVEPELRKLRSLPPGALKIYDGKTYDLVKSVQLLPDADSIAYDSETKYVYVVNGGGDAKMTYSTVSIIDTTSGEKVDNIKVDGDTLDDMAIETSTSRLYVTNVAKTQVEVIDRTTRTLLESWPITLGKRDVAIALDEDHHRLFVGCSSGQIVVFDTETGKELQALPINQGVDDLDFDPKSGSLYAACKGSIVVYKETGPDHYESLGEIPTGPGARTGRLVPQLKRYYAAVPQHENTNAQVLEYEVQ